MLLATAMQENDTTILALTVFFVLSLIGFLYYGLKTATKKKEKKKKRDNMFLHFVFCIVIIVVMLIDYESDVLALSSGLPLVIGFLEIVLIFWAIIFVIKKKLKS